MKKLTLVVLLLSLNICFLYSQTDEKLKSDIRNTGYVHSPLPLDYSKSFETFALTKKVLLSEMLCDMEDPATYKEVWGGSAVKWFMLISEF